VPQFLLDDAIHAGKGHETHIICTQPRRISAIGKEEGGKEGRVVGIPDELDTHTDILLPLSLPPFLPPSFRLGVAERVASERAEPVGEMVGYQIRLEKVGREGGRGGEGFVGWQEKRKIL